MLIRNKATRMLLLMIAPYLAAAASPEQQRQALENAYRAGVLSEQEYQAKRRALDSPPEVPKPSPPAASAAAHPYWRMRMVRVMDTQGFGEPVEVLRLLAPADWRLQSNLHWDGRQMGCPPNIIQIGFRLQAPDGVTALEVLPAYTWQWTDDSMLQQIMRQQAAAAQSCQLAPPLPAADFIRQIVLPNTRRGAQANTVQALPAVAQAEQRLALQANQQLLQAGYVRAVKVDAAWVKLSYQLNQQPVEEWITATVLSKVMPTASSAALMQGQLVNSASNYQLSAYNIFATRARSGQLDVNAKLFAMMIASVRPNPQYIAAVGQFMRNINQTNMQGAADRHRIWQQANQEINAIQQQTYRERQQVQDRIAEQFGQVIRGVESYVDPRTQERIELSAGYKNAWTNARGEYLLSESASFNPNVELQEDWRPLQKEHEK